MIANPPLFTNWKKKITDMCRDERDRGRDGWERERERERGLIAMRERDCGDSQCQENFEMELLRDY
jgi:hypothetical protein